MKCNFFSIFPGWLSSRPSIQSPTKTMAYYSFTLSPFSLMTSEVSLEFKAPTWMPLDCCFKNCESEEGPELSGSLESPSCWRHAAILTVCNVAVIAKNFLDYFQWKYAFDISRVPSCQITILFHIILEGVRPIFHLLIGKKKDYYGDCYSFVAFTE